jgi:predicted metal-dependent hydrolase
MRDPKLEEFIRLFNHQAFFEAHEVLEALWLETTGEQKLFYQGLIQCAVSLAHFQRNNARGANQVGARSLSILKEYGAVRDEICIDALIHDCEAFLTDPAEGFPQIRLTSD